MAEAEAQASIKVEPLPPGEDGWPAEKVFDGTKTCFGFDDLIFLPGHVSEASEVVTSSQLTRTIRLGAPVVSSPTDFVTGTEMAIAMALAGGIGIIHQNQSIAAQAAMVGLVKRHVAGLILEPFTLPPTATLLDLDRLRRDKEVCSVPITENGKVGGKLVGFVTSRDADPVADRGTKVAKIMERNVVTVCEPVTLDGAMEQLRKAKVGKLPIVNAQGNLVSMVCRSDLKKLRAYPGMSRTETGQLLCAAAVTTDGQGDWERASALAEAGVDVLYVDVSESHADGQLTLIQKMKEEYGGVEILAGPVSSCREAKRLMDAGADAIVVGGAAPLGGGALGQSVAVGRAEATTLFEVGKYVKQNYGCPVIAGSGVRNVGQVLKAIGLGASTVMLDDLLAGATESPCQDFFLEDGACREMHMRPGLLPAGRQGQISTYGLGAPVPTKGSAMELIPYFMQGVKRGMRDLGFESMAELHKALASGELRMECRCVGATRTFEACGRAQLQAAHPEVMPAFVSSEGFRSY